MKINCYDVGYNVEFLPLNGDRRYMLRTVLCDNTPIWKPLGIHTYNKALSKVTTPELGAICRHLGVENDCSTLEEGVKAVAAVLDCNRKILAYCGVVRGQKLSNLPTTVPSYKVSYTKYRFRLVQMSALFSTITCSMNFCMC